MPDYLSANYQVRDPQGNVYGPATGSMLRDWVSQGRIVAGMHIADVNDGQWVEVSQHPALSDLFGGGTPAAAQMPQSFSMGGATQSPGYTPQPPADVSYASSTGAKQNVLGLVSLISGIASVVGLVGCLCICIGVIDIPVALTALITGILAMKQIKNNPEQYTGKGMALAGTIMGASALALQLLGVIARVVVLFLHR